MRLAILFMLGCAAGSGTESGAGTGTGAEAEAGAGAEADSDADAESDSDAEADADAVAVAERSECVASLEAIRAAVSASQARACGADDECASVTNPRHPDPEYHLVVHQSDAAAISGDAEAHLARCGASIHHEPINAFRVVEARCTDGRCAAEETSFHIEE